MYDQAAKMVLRVWGADCQVSYGMDRWRTAGLRKEG